MQSYVAQGSFVLQNGFGASAQQYSVVFAANAVGIVLASRLSAALVRGQAVRTPLAAVTAARLPRH